MARNADKTPAQRKCALQVCCWSWFPSPPARSTLSSMVSHVSSLYSSLFSRSPPRQDQEDGGRPLRGVSSAACSVQPRLLSRAAPRRRPGAGLVLGDSRGGRQLLHCAGEPGQRRRAVEQSQPRLSQTRLLQPKPCSLSRPNWAGSALHLSLSLTCIVSLSPPRGSMSSPAFTPSYPLSLYRCCICFTPSSLQLDRGQPVQRTRPISGCSSHLMVELTGQLRAMSSPEMARLTGIE